MANQPNELDNTDADNAIWGIDEAAVEELCKYDSNGDKKKRKKIFQTIQSSGNSSFNKGLYEGAAKWYTDALKRGPMDMIEERANMYFKRASCFREMKLIQLAISDCSIALEIRPITSAKSMESNSLKTMVLRAELSEQNERDWEIAQHDYDTIITMFPDCEKAKSALLERKQQAIELNQTGMACFKKQEFKRATDYFNKASKLIPLASESCRSKIEYNLGSCYDYLNIIDKAVQHLTETVNLGQENYEKALRKRADIYARNENTLENALADYEDMEIRSSVNESYAKIIEDLKKRISAIKSRSKPVIPPTAKNETLTEDSGEMSTLLTDGTSGIENTGAKERFKELIQLNAETENVDFKERLYRIKPIEEQSDKEDGEQAFLKHVLAMYNSVNYKAYRSLANAENYASYLVYGVKFAEQKDNFKTFHPYKKDDRDINTLDRKSILDKISTPISFEIYTIYLTKKESESIHSTLNSFPIRQHQWYYLVEIVHDPMHGPAFCLPSKSAKKRLRGRPSNEKEQSDDCSFLIIYTRSGPSDVKIKVNEGTAGSDIKMGEIYRKVLDKFDSGSSTMKLTDIENEFQKTRLKDSFNILLLNSLPSFEDKHIEELAHIVSHGFNVIVDVDPYNGFQRYFQSSENFSLPRPVFSMHNVMIQSKYDISDDRQNICEGRKILYLSVCGDSSAGIDPGEIPHTRLSNLFYDLFSDFKVHYKVNLHILVGSLSNIQQLKKTENLILNSWDDYNKEQKLQIAINHWSFHQMLVKAYSFLQEQCEFVISSVEGIKQLYGQIFDMNDGTEFVIPMNDRNKYKLNRNLEKQFSQFGQIYHFDIGSNEFINQKTNEEIGTTFNSLTQDFLKGNTINPALFYAKSAYSQAGYIERNHFEQAEIKLKLLVERRNSQELPNCCLTIKHGNSAGGTTLGRWLLYKFRKQYPCFEIYNCKESSTQLQELYSILNTCFIILLDESTVKSFSYLEVEQFVRRLHTPTKLSLPCIGIIVISKESYIDSAGEPKASVRAKDINSLKNEAFEIEITSKLDENEDFAFQNLYRVQFLIPNQPSTIRLFGLFQFGEQYQRLPDIEKDIKILDEKMKHLLLLIYSVNKFCNTGIAIEIVAAILGMEIEIENVKKIYEHLKSPLNDLVLLKHPKSNNNSYELITPTRFFTKYILENVLSGEILTDVISKFVLFDLDSDQFNDPVIRNCVDELMSNLLLSRTIFETAEGLDKHKYSDLFLYSESKLTKRSSRLQSFLTAIVEKLTKLQLQSSDFFQSMLARYFITEVEAGTEALIHVRKFLHLPPGTVEYDQTTQPKNVLLSQAGYILVLYMRLNAKNLYNSLDDSFKDMKVTINLLQRAQNQTNVYPYVNEAQLYYNYIDATLKRNGKSTKDFWNTPDPTIIYYYELALHKLSIVEEMVYLQGFSDMQISQTDRCIAQLKSKLIFIKLDKKSSYEEFVKDKTLVPLISSYYRLETQYKHLREYPVQILQNIYTALTNNIDTLWYENYRECILAAVYGSRTNTGQIAPRLRVETCTSQLLHICDIWSQKYKNSFSPHYFRAILLLLEGLNENDEGQKQNKIRSSKSEFDKMRKLLPQPTDNGPWPKTETSFIVLEKMGSMSSILCQLHPIDKDYSLENVNDKVRIFEGRSSTIQQGFNLNCEELQTSVCIPRHLYPQYKNRAKSRPLYKFFLRITQRGFKTEKIINDHIPKRNENE